MQSAKETYHKELSFVGKNFVLKIQFQYKNLL